MVNVEWLSLERRLGHAPYDQESMMNHPKHTSTDLRGTTLAKPEPSGLGNSFVFNVLRISVVTCQGKADHSWKSVPE